MISTSNLFLTSKFHESDLNVYGAGSTFSLFRDAVILAIEKTAMWFINFFQIHFWSFSSLNGLLLPVLLFVPRLTYSCILSVHQEKCHQYWPAERSARYQYFVVDPMAEYNMPQYILREFKVTDARVRRQNLGPYCDLCVIVHVQSESICVQESNSRSAFILINALTCTFLPFYMSLSFALLILDIQNH